MTTTATSSRTQHSLQERLPTGSPPDLPKSDGTPGAHELTAGSPKYGNFASLHTVHAFGCVPAVGRAFYAACSTCCAREVSVVQHDMRLLGRGL